MRNTEIQLFGQTLPNPLIASSGTFGYGIEQEIPPERVGAITLKSLTAKTRVGNPPPRIAEVSKGEILECYYNPDELEDSVGFVNSIGLQNIGIDMFLAHYPEHYRESPGRFIASIAGESIEEYLLLTEKLQACKDVFFALEVNVSCPNVERGLVFGSVPELTYALVLALKKVGDIPLLVKLTPNVEDICAIAEAAISAGADGLSLINTIKVTVRTRDGKQLTGGLSGPMIWPIAQRLIQVVCERFSDEVPIVAGGGVWTAEDVQKMLSFGATAVGVGTLNFTAPDAILQLLSEYEQP